MTRTVVAVPAFDEKRAIAKVIAGARKEGDSVTVCGDGSGDMTATIAARSQRDPRSSKPTREALFDLYAAGETKVKDIAALCGVEEATVFRWLKTYKIPTRTSVRFSRVHLPERARGPFDITNTGLYDGDGAKATPGRIGFTNSNLD